MYIGQRYGVWWWVVVIVLAGSFVLFGAYAQASPSVTALVTLDLVDRDDGALVYDRQAGVGNLLHSPFFVLDDTRHSFERIEVTDDSFLLQVRQEGAVADAAAVLSGQYLVFLYGFTAIGYIDAASLAPPADDSSVGVVSLAQANGLQRDDFLSHTKMKVTTAKPVVNRYFERKQLNTPPIPLDTMPADTMAPRLISAAIEVPLARHPKITVTMDHQQSEQEDARIIFGGTDVCTALSAGTITSTAIGMPSAWPIYAGVFTGGAFGDQYGYSESERSGYLTPATIETGGGVYRIDELAYTAVDSPRISVRIASERSVPTIPDGITGSYAAVGSVNEEVRAAQMLLNQTACPVAVSGVGSVGRETNYFGGLTRAAVVCYQHLRGVAADGVLTPALYADLYTAYHSKVGSGARGGINDVSAAFSDYYFTLKRMDGTVLFSAAMPAGAGEQQGAARFTFEAVPPLRNTALFDGSTDLMIEIARIPPHTVPLPPPQTYTATLAGPPGVYNGCTLTVADGADNRADASIPLSVITILPGGEGSAPKKPYSSIGEAQKWEQLQQLIQLALLALQFADPYLSVSSVQVVPLGSRAHVSEVRDLQVFLNMAGYPVALTGWGSPGRETQYFGPATQGALETFQRDSGVPVTGEMDRATKVAIVQFVISRFEDVLRAR